MKSNIELNYLAIKLRKKLKYNEDAYVHIFEDVKKIKGLSLVLLPLGENISGICIKQENANVIAINSSFSYGRQRFSLAHELYHLYYDESTGTTVSTIDNIKNNSIEEEANIFASYFLLPYNTLKDEIYKIKKITKNDLALIENSYGISHLALLKRLLDEGSINKSEYDSFSKTNLKSICNQLNISYSLYETNNTIATYGNYIEQVNLLSTTNRISKERKSQLLFDCFREDLL